jgi:hypothetical protein
LTKKENYCKTENLAIIVFKLTKPKNQSVLERHNDLFYKTTHTKEHNSTKIKGIEQQ